MSIARGDFREVLKETSVPLVEFSRDSTLAVLPRLSEITVGIKQTTHSVRGTGGRKLAPPKTDIK